uniref:Uncharacterized protein n=1 Tax=Anopheles maculatus TaxID=74869 RepID=A0A182SR91_9DIPT
MFSFFKRSKSQKGKQKHDKLQLPPEPLQAEECEVPEEHGSAKNAPEDVRRPAEPCAKVASDAYASANVLQTGAHRSHAGDEENQPKNSATRPPQLASSSSPAVPMGSGILAPSPVVREPQGTAGQRQLLPSKWPTSGVSKGADEANGSLAPTGTIDRVSSSDPTRQHGSD